MSDATTGVAATTDTATDRKWVRALAPAAVLVVLYVAVGLKQSSFFGWASARALLEQWPVILMLATGQMLVVLTGRIDLSNASLASLAAMLTVLWLDDLGPVTILLVLLFSGLALAITEGHSVIENTGTLEFLYERTFGIPNVALVSLAVVLLVGAAMHWLPLGRSILAVGNGQMAAAYSGVRVGRVMTTVFGLSGFFAGTAGILIIAWLGAASPKTADNLMLPALAAVVLGGTAITGGLGSIWRTAVGAFIMAVLRVGMDVAGIRPMYQPVIYGVLIIVAVGVTIDRTRLKVVK
ncbi:MAG: ABC transporter permease [Acidimicrobiia bacterium]|nr:ABC transporter permease [Acidimicrobiia bacterium]